MNLIFDYEVSGDKALFSVPMTKLSGQKMSYMIPTYEAIKGITSSIYWKPGLTWVPIAVRVMNEIRTESEGKNLMLWDKSSRDRAIYLYLKDVRYQVRVKLEWNMNRRTFSEEWNPGNQDAMMKRAIKQGGRRDVFLGTRECQGFIRPCVFGEGNGFYDNREDVFMFGEMFHGFTYADEAYDDRTRGKRTKRYWTPMMYHGIINFSRPEECNHISSVPCEIKMFPDKSREKSA